ncbi:HEPN domain-containing protein [Candidatus Woesearchaeota archaeon]|nr:HEPN domain-containing protein [Candidatus Woesearchaeota archaeon]
MGIIDELPDNLPTTEEKIENAFRECQKEKREVVKTRTFIEVPPEEYHNYLDSAIGALNAAKILLDNHCYEWVIVPAYSAIYQVANAILIKELGKECRDHFCILITLLKIKKIGWEEFRDANYVQKILEKVSEEDIKFASKLRLARSAVIYKPAPSYNEAEIAKEVLERAKKFVNAVISIL